MSNGARLDWAEARLRLARATRELEPSAERPPAERERILRERAARLARPPEAELDQSRLEDLLIAVAGGERFAIPLSTIVEVVRAPQCAAVPLAPPALAGVIQVRGEIRPVFRPRGAGPGPSGFVLLARAGGREAGLAVDRVEDIRPDSGAERRPAPPGSPHILWMTPDLIAVLDPARLFPEEME